jgi:glycogen debranching enzyme
MLLPLGTALAGGTLRALAARQGSRTDPVTGEAPGKIMHELRRPDLRPWTAGGGTGLRLPPLYYGTVDATPLWVCLLHDAWRWGMAEDEVAALLPHAEAALGWLADGGAPDGSAPDGGGFVEYLDPTGHGLANQGWKDSADAVRFADGSRAAPPVALCEVQGYAYEAARHGADLLEAFGRPGAYRWRQWAADLAGAFRERFWVDAPAGRYPALALDGAKRPADVVTSNIGHLLGTGLLDRAESALVARRLVAADLDSGYGLRTMSAAEVAYAPLSYHCGSVWPHDTAIVLLGLSRAGYGDLAGPLIEGLLRAGAAFDYRLPELYAGDGREQVPRPVPYPAACRPQAWSAAAAVALLQVLLGLHADVPRGRLLLRPVRPQPTGALSVTGLRAGGQPVRVGLAADGTVTGVFAGGLTVETEDTAQRGPG